MSRKKASFLTACLVACSSLASARDGDLLRRFGENGVSVQRQIAGTGYSITAISRTMELPDGRILAASTVSTLGGALLAAVVRLSADGVLDATFGNLGVFVVPTGPADPDGGEGLDLLALGSDRFVLVGRAVAGNLQPRKYSRSCTLLAALDADGQPDTAFGGSGSNGTICFAFGSPDPVYNLSRVGSALPALGGGFYVSGPNSANDLIGVARLTDGGVPDPSFGTNGVCYLENSAGTGLLRRDLQGHLVVAGVFGAQTPAPPEGRPLGAALIDDQCGQDPDYVPRARVETAGSAIQELVDAAFDAQARLFLAVLDQVEAPSHVAYPFVVIRFRADGALDDTFNPAAQQPGSPGVAKLAIGDGDLFFDSIDGVWPTDGGTYVSGGLIVGASQFIVMARLLDDGAFDSSFGNPSTPGISSYSLADYAAPRGGIVSASQGSVLLQGTESGFGCGIVLRVSIDSVFDDGFESAVAVACSPPREAWAPSY